MKTIKDHISLAGQSETITISELRRAPGEVMNLVALGKTFIITRLGKEIAVLSRLPGETLMLHAHPDGTFTYHL